MSFSVMLGQHRERESEEQMTTMFVRNIESSESELKQILKRECR